MKGLVIKSDGREFVALFPLDYGWWLVTRFESGVQSVLFVQEDDWATLWAKRGIPIEMPEETS